MKRFRLVATLLTSSLLMMNINTSTVASKESKITVNDDAVGKGNMQIEFIGPWVHEGGYPERFEGGDEHWVTNAQFGSNFPSFIFRFVGTSVTLYGHKVPNGATADVYLDGEKIGELDYYNPSRIEKAVLFKVGDLENTEHEIKVQLIEKKNPNAGSTHEASLDYIEVTTPYKEFPVTGISTSKKSIFLLENLDYTLDYTLTPSYANIIPKVLFSSSDESVATVDEKGKIVAKKEGEAKIIIQPEGIDAKSIVTVTVKANDGILSGFIAEDSTRTISNSYYDLIKSNYNKESGNWQDTSFLADEVYSRIVLNTKEKEVKNIKVSATDFKTENGDILPKECIDLRFMSEVYAHDIGVNIADVIYGGTEVTMEPKSIRSIWVTINTPISLKAGIYKGKINVTADNNVSMSFDYTLEVLALKQPEPEKNNVQLELWMYPYSSNRYYSGKTTKEYFGNTTQDLRYIYLDDRYLPQLKSQVELYAKAGGKAITVTIVEDPWNSQTPDPYPSMIKWTEKKDGAFSFDYKDFDKWVQLNLDCGVNGQIKTFSISCWGNQITYLGKGGKVKTESLQTGSKRWKEVWTQFLKDYMKHTTEKGWFDKVYMAMDERPVSEIKANLDLIESVKNKDGKSFKVSMAVFDFNAEAEFIRLHDISFAYALDAKKVSDIAKERRGAGLLTTLYTCGGQNSAIPNNPYESYYSILYTYKTGTDGFLRWALDAFNTDPIRSSEHRLFASGDIYLIYPDEINSTDPKVKTSQRFEMLAQGIRDVAKVKYLKGIAPEYADKLDAVIQSLGTKNSGDMLKESERVRSEIMNYAREIAGDHPYVYTPDETADPDIQKKESNSNFIKFGLLGLAIAAVAVTGIVIYRKINKK